MAGPMDAVSFAERVLQLLDQAAFTATYKYAVLVALLDLVLENTSRSGTPPRSVTTRQLAEKVLELYWPQTRPYAALPAGPDSSARTGGVRVRRLRFYGRSCNSGGEHHTPVQGSPGEPWGL